MVECDGWWMVGVVGVAIFPGSLRNIHRGSVRYVRVLVTSKDGVTSSVSAKGQVF